MRTAGIVLVCLLALTWVGCRSAKQKAADEARERAEKAEIDRKIAADEAAAKAVQEVLDVRLQKACASKKVKYPEDSWLVKRCDEEAVKLAARPDTIDWPGVLDVKPSPPAQKACSVEYRGWYDAKNVANAKVRINYLCTYDPRQDGIRVNAIR